MRTVLLVSALAVMAVPVAAYAASVQQQIDALQAQIGALQDPTLDAVLVSAVVALAISGISAWASIWLLKDRLRTELKLEFAAETAIRELLSEEKWKLRSFEEIEKRLKGFEENELRKLLIRSGALSFKSREGKERHDIKLVFYRTSLARTK